VPSILALRRILSGESYRCVAGNAREERTYAWVKDYISQSSVAKCDDVTMFQPIKDKQEYCVDSPRSLPKRSFFSLHAHLKIQLLRIYM